MQTVMSISPKELCLILSAPEDQLNAFQLALKRALEKANTPDELKVIRDHACLTNQVQDIGITRSGQVQRRM